MKSVKNIAILFCLILLTADIFAQTPDDAVLRMIESLAEDSDGETDYNELVETYYSLTENKININSDDINILGEYKFLDHFQIEKIKEYRRSYGDIKIVEELIMIEGLYEENVIFLLPIIKFEHEQEVNTITKKTPKNLLRYGKHKVLAQIDRTLQPQNAYPSHVGSAERLLFRYNYDYKDVLQTGFVFEKDAGEKSLTDFWSFHVFVKNLKFVEALALGDYKVSFGQGLTIGNGLAFTTTGSSLMRRNAKIRASKTADESGHLRGAAATLKHKYLELTLFFSNRSRDATVSMEDSITGEILEVSSLQNTGLHRTENETAAKDAIKCRLFGGNISFKTSNFQVGYTIHHSNFGCRINPKETIYNRLYFRGDRLTVQGLDFYHITQHTALYGEFSISDNGGMAGIVGLTVKPTGYIGLTLSYRNYSKNYQNFYGNAYGGAARDEQGWYFGTSMTIAPKWNVAGGIDLARHDMPRNLTYAPSSKQKYDVKLSHKVGDKTEFFVQYKYNEKMKNTTTDVFQKYLTDVKTHSISFNISYPFGEKIEMKNKVLMSETGGDEIAAGRSWLFLHDIIFKTEKPKLNIALRYALFDAQNGSVYAYENDVLYSFSITSLTHKGIRTYLVVKTEIFDAVEIAGKIGATIYDEEQSIGKTTGKLKADAKLQIIGKF